jgi:hypothetical protein
MFCNLKKADRIKTQSFQRGTIMKPLFIFTLLLIAAILGHDTWLSYKNDLPFALSDFGWVVNNYIPSSEKYIMETMDSYGQKDHLWYIGWLFKLETVWVALIFMSFFLAIGLFVKLSNAMGDMRLPSFGKKKMGQKSMRKRDTKNTLKYNRK